MLIDLSSDLDSKETNIFNPQEWINKGLKFPTDPPATIRKAYNDLQTLPSEYNFLTPFCDQTIRDLLSFRLPNQSSAIISYKADLFFSNESPNESLSCLASRPILPKNILRSLQSRLGQAWFDGAQSIDDKRFKNSRLPLWVLAYWKEQSDAVSASINWNRSELWLANQRSGIAQPMVQETEYLLSTMGWNSPVAALGASRWNTTTLKFSRVLSDSCLSDDLVDMAMEYLAHNIGIDEKKQHVLLCTLDFSRAIASVSDKSIYDKESCQALRVCEHYFKDRLGKLLYFPVYLLLSTKPEVVGHWIAFKIDFEKHQVSYGDSLNGKFTSLDKFLKKLFWWLEVKFRVEFEMMGNTMEHGLQTDDFSCGICTINTIEHAIFEVPLWNYSRHGYERVKWFNILAKKHLDLGMPNRKNKMDVQSLVQKDKTIATPLEDLGYTLAPPYMINNGMVMTADLPVLPKESEVSHTFTTSSTTSSLSIRKKNKNLLDSSINPFTKAKKRPVPAEENPAETEQNSPKNLKQNSEPIEQTVTCSYTSTGGALGIGRSTRYSRARKANVESGDFVSNFKRLENFTFKIKAMDVNATFPSDHPRKVQHSLCRAVIMMKEVYNTSRFQEHVDKCKVKSPIATLDDHNFQTQPNDSGSLVSAAANYIEKPCPGLRGVDDEKIEVYLDRTGVLGGGSKSLTYLSKQMYRKPYRLLSKSNQGEVRSAQFHSRLWVNDAENNRIYSVKCVGIVKVERENGSINTPCCNCFHLRRTKLFTNAIRRPRPKLNNSKYTPKCFRLTRLAKIYGRCAGIEEIIEAEDSKAPCIRFAEGVLRGEYDNEQVFTGMMEAMVVKRDKKARGVGSQNFAYAPAYRELMHLICLHSHRAYQTLRRYLPAPDPRTFQIERAQKPRFQLGVCEISLDFVVDQVRALKYDGLLSLSCDDTKLLPALRPYWDDQQKSWFLIGGTGDSIAIADPALLKQLLEITDIQKAEKVRLWCLQIPIMKMAPIVVAAMPISNDLDAETLCKYLKDVVLGLLSRGLRISSYACDGTEVERKTQRLFAESFRERITYTIPHPDGCAHPSIIVPLIIVEGSPIVLLQDSKHALKTARNNATTGTRIVTIGSYVAMYCQILDIAKSGGPIYLRDVEKLDRQDDNAASRLFSAATLNWLCQNRKSNRGLIVYLFVFGELVDAYQNRSISHLERIQICLRTLFFMQMWLRFLEKAGYSLAKHCISREGIDIMHILIYGLLSLIYLYRDHNTSRPTPLLPWLHSSEACEHVFGICRQIVPDFTMLDFLYMMPKLSVGLREALQHDTSSDSRARASGYNHTYFDTRGLNLSALSTFPSDVDITRISVSANEEALNLFALLGVSPSQLSNYPTLRLPSIHTSDVESRPNLHDQKSAIDIVGWEADEDDLEVELDEDCIGVETEAHELLHLIEDDENISGTGIVRLPCDVKKLQKLKLAAVSLSLQDSMIVHAYPELTEAENREFLQDQCDRIAEMIADRLPPVQAPEEAVTTFVISSATEDEQIDYEPLLRLRLLHQTETAAHATRSKLNIVPLEDNNDKQNKVIRATRQQVLKEMNTILKENEDPGIGTGVGRKLRWTNAKGCVEQLNNCDEEENEHPTGNSFNAAEVLKANAGKTLARRSAIFLGLNLNDFTTAHVSKITPLRVSPYSGQASAQSFGLITIGLQILIGKVLAIYKKGGGKAGKHGYVSSEENIAAISYIVVQAFENMYGRQFGSIATSMATLRAKKFALIPSSCFLCMLDSSPSINDSFIEISISDYTRFKGACEGRSDLANANIGVAMKSLMARNVDTQPRPTKAKVKKIKPTNTTSSKSTKAKKPRVGKLKANKETKAD